jgi:RNA polymerase sigma factor for flagellar operon FliA
VTSRRVGAPSNDEQQLVRQHLPLVHHVVSAMRSGLPAHVSADDLVSAAMVGLLQAVRGFDEARGVPFPAYAKQRIRGAVLDELRSVDWATRSLRSKDRSLRDVEQATGAGLEQAAAAVGLSVDEARQVRADVHRASVVSIDALAPDAAGDALPSEGVTPEATLVQREHIGYLRDAVDLLPDRLRHVVVGIFFEERTLASLAEDLGVTESRICHMRAEATALLREAMREATADDMETADEATLPTGVAARRRAAYCATVSAASDYRARLDRPAPVVTSVPA